MRKKPFFTTLIALFLLFIFNQNNVYAGKILYQENFNSGAPGWSGHRQGWKWDENPSSGFANTPAYHHSWWEGLKEDSFAILDKKNWQDIAFEAKVKANSGNAGIAIRMTTNDISWLLPEMTGYRLIMVESGRLRFQRYRLAQPNGQVGDHRNPYTLVEKIFDYQHHQWYTLRIEARGSNFKCYVNGNLEIEYDDLSEMTDYEESHGYTHPDGPLFPEGSIGLVEFKGTVWWDDIIVESLFDSDLNDDGLVDEIDLTILLDNWDDSFEEDYLEILLSNWKIY